MAQDTIKWNDKTDTTPSNTAQWTGPDTQEVKDIVNANSADAEARITSNANNIASNTGLISTNAGNISTNAADIAQNTSDIAGKVDKASVINKQAANYTVTEADNNNIIECNGSFAVTFADGLSAGFACAVVNIGTGTITIAATSTIAGNLSLSEQYSSRAVYQTDTDSFISI